MLTMDKNNKKLYPIKPSEIWYNKWDGKIFADATIHLWVAQITKKQICGINENWKAAAHCIYSVVFNFHSISGC